MKIYNELDLQNNKITNLATPVNPGDGVNKGYSDTHKTSDGSDHGFIDQDVKVLSTPKFQGIVLDTLSVEPSYEKGKIFMDPVKHQPTIMLDNTEVRLNLGFETLVPIVNRTGIPFVSGTVIYPTGYENSTVSKFVVDRANAQDKHRISPVAVITTAIAIGGTGYATKLGLVEHVDTSAFAVGDTLYVSQDDSGLPTNVRPVGGAYPTVIGFVVISAVDGTIQVDITESELTTDVTNQNGFPESQRFLTSFNFNTTTLTMTLTAIAEYYFYEHGEKFEVTGDRSVTWLNTEGLKVVSFRNGVLTLINSPVEADFNNIILQEAFVCAFYWNVTNQQIEFNLDERHGLMPPIAHLWAHQAVSTIYLDGMGLTINDIDNNSPTNASLQYSLTSGHNKDEDIPHEIIEKTITGIIREYHFEGLAPNPVLRRQATPNQYGLSGVPGGLPYYNQLNVDTWQTTQALTGDFIWRHIVAIPESDKTRTSYIVFMGTNRYVNKANAEAGVSNEVATIKTLYPAAESTFAYSILYEVKSSWTNLYKARIVTLSNDGFAVDYRAEQSKGSAAVAGGGSHTTLSDRDTPDQHPGSSISFDNTVSGLVATNVQTAIDQLDGFVDLNTAHKNLTNNPHVLTAAQIGADTSAEVDAKIAASKDSILNGASPAYDTLIEIQALMEADDTQTTAMLTAIGLNTAKVGITTQQAADIVANNAKISYTDAAAVALNTAKVGITTQQATDITTNNAKVGITAGQASAIVANTAKISYTDAAAVALNTAKVGITAGQASAIVANTAKVGITTGQASAIVVNTAKISFDTFSSTKLAGIEEGAQVNVAETDPIFTAHAAFGITGTNITNWNTAHGWGDHSGLYLGIALKGANNGLAELDSSGLVPSSQLPSFVDDVVEAANLASFPITGESGKIYIALDTNKTYRWSGTVYVVIGSSLALGTTSATAYRGDHGLIAYNHSQVVHAPTNADNTAANETSHADVIVDGDFTSTGIMKRTTAGVYAIVTDNSANWNTAFGWGNHATQGYITGFTNNYLTGLSFNTLDGVLTGTRNGLTNLTVDLDGRYLTSFTETDPIFTAHPAFGVTAQKITNWDTSFGWGNHSGLYSLLGHTHDYAATVHDHTGVYEPEFTKNTAFNKNFGTTLGTVTQGNDSRLSDARTPLTHSHTFASLTAKPTTISGYGITDALVLGITNLTAHRGDHGVIAYNHSQVAHAPSDANNYVHPTGDGNLHVIATSTTNNGKVLTAGATPGSLTWTEKTVNTDTIYTHPEAHAISFITGLQTALNGKVDDSQVLTNVPAGALFTDTVYTHPINHAPSIIVQDLNNRFVTDAQIGNWDTAHGWGDHSGLYLGVALKGANSGLAELDASGYVPSSQLPAYIDDVLEFAALASFPATGESGKIYIALDTNKTYRWSGSVYVVIGSSLALGETSATAYRGDRGKIAYDHSLTAHAPSNADNTAVNQTSHADVVVDGDFTSAGLMKRNTAGVYSIVTDNSSNWNTAFGWGNHATQGYITGFTNNYLTGLSFNTGNGIVTATRNGLTDLTVDLDGRYLTSFTETDPVFLAHVASGITALNITNWNTAHGWGDHAGLYSLLGHTHDYAATVHDHTGVYEPAFTKNTAFNKNFGTTIGTVTQGNDSRLSDARTPLAHSHTFASLTSKPTTLAGYGITDSLVLGSTSTTAHRGDHGVIAYNHALSSHAPSDANNYVLPEATATTMGGIELFSNTDQTVPASGVSAVASRTYGIQLNAAGQAVVNVPWVDTDTNTWRPEYILELAADGTRGGVQIGYTENGKNYPVELNEEKMFVNVPWTDNDTVYSHPASHPATMITEDASHRFITDTERTNWNTAYGWGDHLGLYITTGEKGASSGVAELDASGKVPSSQLPSFVDDVVEAANLASFPVTGESGKIYITLDTNKTYRWSGSAYIEISSSLALGTTSSTAYRGDHGLIAYNHALSPHNYQPAGTYNPVIGTDADINTSGAQVIDTLVMTDGVITSHSLRTLTLANLGYSAYVLPPMTSTVLGGGKLFSDTVQAIGANAVSATASRTYGLQVNGAGQLVVNVPWVDTNTVYDHPAYNGDDFSIDTGPLTGATVVSDVDINVTTDALGHVTDANATIATRELTLGDLGWTRYVLPEATSAAMGGIKLFSDTDQLVGANAVSATASRTYGIQLNAAGQAVVNVPWVDTNTQIADTWRGIDDVPVDGQTEESISSNWAFDHNAGTGNGKHVPALGTEGQFLKHDGTWGTPAYIANTNNYVTGVSGSGDGTLTLTRLGLGNLTADLSHTHGEYLTSQTSHADVVVDSDVTEAATASKIVIRDTGGDIKTNNKVIATSFSMEYDATSKSVKFAFA